MGESSRRVVRIAIVVDPRFGARIEDLAGSRHLWVVESAANDPVVERLRHAAQAYAASDIRSLGPSSFPRAAEESPEEACIGISEWVNEHHSEWDHYGPWSEIEVVGARLMPETRSAFSECGATEFEETPGGFVCRRSH